MFNILNLLAGPVFEDPSLGDFLVKLIVTEYGGGLARLLIIAAIIVLGVLLARKYLLGNQQPGAYTVFFVAYILSLLLIAYAVTMPIPAYIRDKAWDDAIISQGNNSIDSRVLLVGVTLLLSSMVIFICTKLMVKR